MKLSSLIVFAEISAQEFVPLAGVDQSLKLPKLQNDLSDTLYDRLVVNSDPSDLVLYSYDENLVVESPDAEDYSAFWYGDVGTDQVAGEPKSYENSYYDDRISSIDSFEGLKYLAENGDQSAASALGSRSLRTLVQNVLLNNQDELLEAASEDTTIAPETPEPSGPVFIRLDETDDIRSV